MCVYVYIYILYISPVEIRFSHICLNTMKTSVFSKVDLLSPTKKSRVCHSRAGMVRQRWSIPRSC